MFENFNLFANKIKRIQYPFLSWGMLLNAHAYKVVESGRNIQLFSIPSFSFFLITTVWSFLKKVTASCDGNGLVNLVSALVLSLILWDICVSWWFLMNLFVSQSWQHFLQSCLRIVKIVQMTKMAIQSNCVWWKMRFIP